MTNGHDPTRDAIDEALAGLVRDQRQWIARDPVRVRTLLQHSFAGSPIAQSREIEAAVLAIQFGVFDLLAAPDPTAVASFAEQLSSHGGLSHDEATWAVSSWARAAGVPLAGPVAPASPLAATTAVPPPAPVPAYPASPTPPPVYSASPTPPPGYPPTGYPPATATATASRLPLVIGLVVLVFLLLVAAVAFGLTRRSEVATPPVTIPVTAAPDTSAATTSTTEEETTATRRATTTRGVTTTTAPDPTITDPPTTPAQQWSTFNDPSGRYSIDFPASPQLSTSSTNIGGYDVGIFDYGAASQGITYELAVLELPPGYYFPNPQTTLETVVGSFVSTDGGSVTARDGTAFAGNPALFLALKKGDSEANVFGLIAGNRIYVMQARGADFVNADFPRFRSSFKIN